MILEQTQPDPPSGCEPYGGLNVNATGDLELRLPPSIEGFEQKTRKRLRSRLSDTARARGEIEIRRQKMVPRL